MWYKRPDNSLSLQTFRLRWTQIKPAKRFTVNELRHNKNVFQILCSKINNLGTSNQSISIVSIETPKHWGSWNSSSRKIQFRSMRKETLDISSRRNTYQTLMQKAWYADWSRELCKLSRTQIIWLVGSLSKRCDRNKHLQTIARVWKPNLTCSLTEETGFISECALHTTPP